MYNKDAKPCIVSIRNNYKESKMTFSDILAEINEEVAELLKTVKPEYLKALRVNKSFDVPNEKVDFNINIFYSAN